MVNEIVNGNRMSSRAIFVARGRIFNAEGTAVSCAYEGQRDLEKVFLSTVSHIRRPVSLPYFLICILLSTQCFAVEADTCPYRHHDLYIVLAPRLLALQGTLKS